MERYGCASAIASSSARCVPCHELVESNVSLSACATNDPMAGDIAEGAAYGSAAGVAAGALIPGVRLIEGAAISSIKIDGVNHEFQSIDGVVEDVTDIVLNLKKILNGLSNAE